MSNSSRTHRSVRLDLAFGRLRSLAFAPEFLHAGSNGGEVVSSAGPFTAFPPILVIGRGPAIGCERPSVTLLTLGKKARLRACGGLLNPRPAARLVRRMALIGFGQRVGLLTVVVLMLTR